MSSISPQNLKGFHIIFPSLFFLCQKKKTNEDLDFSPDLFGVRHSNFTGSLLTPFGIEIPNLECLRGILELISLNKHPIIDFLRI